jgi:hypothetical protein
MDRVKLAGPHGAYGCLAERDYLVYHTAIMPGRQSKLRAVSFVILALSLAVISWWFSRSSSERPNLILICMDAVRFDTFWLPEEAGLRDPFAVWAERAVRFNNAHTVSSWTLPSVASVLTGLLPDQHGAGSFQQPVADLNTMPPSKLPDSIVTLPEILQEHGFETIHLTLHPWTADPAYGLAGSFSRTETVRQPLQSALEWLERCRKPCFINVHLLSAHEYGQSLAQVNTTVQAMDPELRAAARHRMPLPVREALTSEAPLFYLEYVRRVAGIRDQLAVFLKSVEKMGLAAETVTIAYSDHGEEFGEHGSGGHGKSLFQETLRVPLLAWVPDTPGQTVSMPVSLVDLPTTLFFWLGLSIPSTGLGRNLAEGLEPLSGQPPGDRPIFASGIAYGNDAATVLLGRWKLVYDRVSQQHVTYDLESDPLEMQPLASPPPEVERQLLSYVMALQTSGQRKGSTYPLPDPELLERLQALGYLSGARP